MALELSAASYLEAAFVRWVLSPAVRPEIRAHIVAQSEVAVRDHKYRLDYEIVGETYRIAIELDGFEFHSHRSAFTYDRMRQNDLAATSRLVIRFSYDAVRLDTARCVEQLQSVLSLDPVLRRFVIPNPAIERPEMDPSPLRGMESPLPRSVPATYFDNVREKISLRTLRRCQEEAFSALGNYYHAGGRNAACVMSVGAGKTALGVASVLAFARRRALVVTPGTVIRGTFDRALDHQAVGNALYGLPNGPLIPGAPPPRVLTLDQEEGAIRSVTRSTLLETEIIVTNFHSLGSGEDPDDLLSKLSAQDIDFIVVDEAHIAASESYQRLFQHFGSARTLLMSACFQRLDGKPIDADVVYRYRLIDSIADGNAKNLRVRRFSPDDAGSVYEMVWPDGGREEIIGRDAILALLSDERKLATITAKSHEPIRRVMRVVVEALEQQAKLLYPVKPRVLFSAIGERHAEQIASIAEDHGIPCGYVHYSMSRNRIKAIRARFEQESGDLQGLVQLKMLGQGYDFPPITIVVPMRPYGSFSEFYQFIGRGIRVLSHPALIGRVGPAAQFLDVVYHAELGLDEHVETIYRENDMDPITQRVIPQVGNPVADKGSDLPIAGGSNVAERPETFVMFQPGSIEQRVIHDDSRVERRRDEREREALAQRYSAYAQGTDSPVTFAQFEEIMRKLRD